MWNEIVETKELLDLSLEECKSRGAEMVDAKARYYTAKAQAAYRLKQQGHPSSFIAMVLKGEPEVCEAMKRHEMALVRYENAKEARLVYKKWLDLLNDQYKREWGSL